MCKELIVIWFQYYHIISYSVTRLFRIQGFKSLMDVFLTIFTLRMMTNKRTLYTFIYV